MRVSRARADETNETNNKNYGICAHGVKDNSNNFIILLSIVVLVVFKLSALMNCLSLLSFLSSTKQCIVLK